MASNKSVIGVFQWLESVRSYAKRENLHEGIDVRVGAYKPGQYHYFEGEACYDTYHCTACESDCVMPDDSDDELLATAERLIEGVEDQFAMYLDGEA